MTFTVVRSMIQDTSYSTKNKKLQSYCTSFPPPHPRYPTEAYSTGYGQVPYIGIENAKSDIHCVFLMGKACVAPVKTTTIPHFKLTAATVLVRVDEMTIPRLELTTATVSVHVCEMGNELDEPVESKTYWTDSTTVLSYI